MSAGQFLEVLIEFHLRGLRFVPHTQQPRSMAAQFDGLTAEALT